MTKNKIPVCAICGGAFKVGDFLCDCGDGHLRHTACAHGPEEVARQVEAAAEVCLDPATEIGMYQRLVLVPEIAAVVAQKQKERAN